VGIVLQHLQPEPAGGDEELRGGMRGFERGIERGAVDAAAQRELVLQDKDGARRCDGGRSQAADEEEDQA
jgi:hypothetical protein